MSLYRESNVSVAQNTNNQRDVHHSSTSSFHDTQSSPEQASIAQPNLFSSSIRSDPLVGLIDNQPDIKTRSTAIQTSNQTTYLPNKTLIDTSQIIKQTPVNEVKFNQLPNVAILSQKPQSGIPNQSINFNSHVTFGNNQNLANHGPPNFQPTNNTSNVNPMLNTNQSNTNWIPQIPRSMSTTNMRSKIPYTPIPSSPINNGSNILVSPANISNTNCISKFGIQDAQSHISNLPDVKPVYFEDEESGTYGVRCVCGKAHHDGLLVQCDECKFWLHAICNCIARESKDEPFSCPFCRPRVIRCKCGNNNSYEIPIVQCVQCKYWVHKRCEHLGFGVVPTTFICSNCGGNEFIMPILKPVYKNKNKVSFVDCDRYEVIQSIPEGQFRNFVIADLNRSELHLHETVNRYFQEFAIPLFQKSHEFWKIFVDTLVTLLNCEKNEVLETIDDFAKSFLYSKAVKQHKFTKPIKFSMSESILPIIESSLSNLPVIDDRFPKKLYLNPSDSVCISEPCEDDEFICELPGFLVHTDEVRADDGISFNYIRLYSSDLIIDMDGSPFQFAPQINRSFHYNCYAKLYVRNTENDKKVDSNENVDENSEKNSKNINAFDNVHVGLFATRMKGPLQDIRRGTPVTADSVLYLPLDGEIPYALPKCEWKSSRAKAKIKSNSRNKTQQKKNETGQHIDMLNPVNLSLLTAFCEDAVPPMPITIVNEKEAINRTHANSALRSRRTSRAKVVD